MKRISVRIGFGVVALSWVALALGACTNDYSQYSFLDGDASPRTTDGGGTGGTAASGTSTGGTSSGGTSSHAIWDTDSWDTATTWGP